jgi:hypothetical protein
MHSEPPGLLNRLPLFRFRGDFIEHPFAIAACRDYRREVVLERG